MTTEETTKNIEPASLSDIPPSATHSVEESLVEEKPIIPAATESAPVSDPLSQDKVEESTIDLALVHSKAQEKEEKSSDQGSINRDAVLQRVEAEKRISLIKAWEESEKSRAENKAHKNISAIGAWENRKKASIESQMKKMEEKLEMKKASYVEKMRNKVAYIHKCAEEKKAMVEAKLGEDVLQAEEFAAKYRAKGTFPARKILGCL